jgi:hypothetical protein
MPPARWFMPLFDRYSELHLSSYIATQNSTSRKARSSPHDRLDPLDRADPSVNGPALSDGGKIKEIKGERHLSNSLCSLPKNYYSSGVAVAPGSVRSFVAR